MNGICLTRGLGNVADLDMYTRDNIHEYEAFIYGMQQNKTISAEILMSLKPTIAMKLLFYLQSEISMSLSLSDLNILCDKYMRLENKMNISSSINLSLEKRLRLESYLSIVSDINIVLQKTMKARDIQMSCTSTLKLGIVRKRKIADIDNLMISDIENMTIEELCYTRVV